MRLFSSTLLLSLATLARLGAAKSSSGDSVLVLLDPSLQRENYSIFFDGLEKRGYDLTFRGPKDVEPAIAEYDAPSFSHIILFTPETKSYAQDITPQSLVSALSQGTNLLIAMSPKQTPLTSLAAEFGLVLPPPGTPLISHHPARPDPPTVIPIPVGKSPLLGPHIAPVWFSGASHALNTNPNLFPILLAPAESFAADSNDDLGADGLVEATEKGGEGLWAGSRMSVVTGFQTTHNSRAVFAGSVDIFSDEYAKKNLPSGKQSGNAQFCGDITSWVFQESLALRIDDVTHHRVNDTAPPEVYTTSDQIVYTAHVSAFNPRTSSWEPYSGLTDLQLEFTMLDPHVRIALPAVVGAPGKYEVQFRVPDRHGVFKFVIDWRRRGYTYLQSSTTVPVVPPRHDGYPRFLSAAWPYYASAMSTSVGFLLFAAIWLAGDVKGEHKTKKTTKTE